MISVARRSATQTHVEERRATKCGGFAASGVPDTLCLRFKKRGEESVGVEQLYTAFAKGN